MEGDFTAEWDAGVELNIAVGLVAELQSDVPIEPEDPVKGDAASGGPDDVSEESDSGVLEEPDAGLSEEPDAGASEETDADALEDQLLELVENRPRFSLWKKVKYVAGGVFVGLVTLLITMTEVEIIIVEN
jgi:hypothetical protein